MNPRFHDNIPRLFLNRATLTPMLTASVFFCYKIYRNTQSVVLHPWRGSSIYDWRLPSHRNSGFAAPTYTTIELLLWNYEIVDLLDNFIGFDIPILAELSSSDAFAFKIVAFLCFELLNDDSLNNIGGYLSLIPLVLWLILTPFSLLTM